MSLVRGMTMCERSFSKGIVRVIPFAGHLQVQYEPISFELVHLTLCESNCDICLWYMIHDCDICL